MNSIPDSQVKDFENQIEDFLPNHSVDCVILGYENQQLKVLLLQWKMNGSWCLPGGFIFKNEDIDDAAHRVLQERTCLNEIFLNQFHTFGRQHRAAQPNSNEYRLLTESMYKLGFTKPKVLQWFNKRFITTGYFALVDIARARPQPDFLSAVCEWKDVGTIPPLILDHQEILEKAIEHLRLRLNYVPLGLSLLPIKFTMQDLQKLYEAILDKPLERSNFQRKILKLDFLNRHEKQMTGAANKAPYLYSFKSRKYHDLLADGIGFL
ncbi:MAG: NUDIX domain-containing protein [Saonia sp.]